MNSCAVEDCGRVQQYLVRGMCNMHYLRWKRHGDPSEGARSKQGGPCSVAGCNMRSERRGWCRKHYTRWQRHGDPVAATVRWPLTDAQRILRRYITLPNGCWLWCGTRTHDGYGMTRASGRNVLAHRWFYEHFVGPIPEGLQLDHLCRVEPCVNPRHLEPVTGLENIRRAQAWRA